MSKPVLWVAELFVRNDEWAPTVYIDCTRRAGRQRVRAARVALPKLKFRLRQYARVEKRRK